MAKGVSNPADLHLLDPRDAVVIRISPAAPFDAREPRARPCGIALPSRTTGFRADDGTRSGGALWPKRPQIQTRKGSRAGSTMSEATFG